MKRTPVSTAGLVLAGLLGIADVATLALGDGEHPPVAVAVVGAVLGIATLIGVVSGWRGSRAGVVAVIVTRLLSALGAVPAFFADGVPAAAVTVAGIGVALTLVCVALLATTLIGRVATAAS